MLASTSKLGQYEGLLLAINSTKIIWYQQFAVAHWPKNIQQGEESSSCQLGGSHSWQRTPFGQEPLCCSHASTEPMSLRTFQAVDPLPVARTTFAPPHDDLMHLRHHVDHIAVCPKEVRIYRSIDHCKIHMKIFDYIFEKIQRAEPVFLRNLNFSLTGVYEETHITIGKVHDWSIADAVKMFACRRLCYLYLQSSRSNSQGSGWPNTFW